MMGFRLIITAFLCIAAAIQSTGAQKSALENSEYIDPNHYEFQISVGEGEGSFFIAMKAFPYVLHGRQSGIRDLSLSPSQLFAKHLFNE